LYISFWETAAVNGSETGSLYNNAVVLLFNSLVRYTGTAVPYALLKVYVFRMRPNINIHEI